MKIKWQLTIFFGIFFLILAALVFYLFKGKPLILLASEVGLLFVGLFFFFLLNHITKPIGQLALGLDAIKDQDFTGFLVPSSNKETDVLVEVYNKMIENIRRERVFQQEQHFFLQNLIQILPVGFLIFDYDDKLRQYNPEAAKILKLSVDDLGKTLENDWLWKAISEQNELVKLHEGAQYLRVYSDRFKHRGFYQRFVILEEAGDEILQIERQSYGKVIRMMAHEVKNSVGAINSILESVLKAENLDPMERADYLKMIIDRNRMLNRFMDNFADVVRLPLPEMKMLNFTELVERVFRLMQLRLNDKAIDFHLEIPDKAVFLKGSAEQLEQALINIVLNAIEAIPQNGKIKFSLTESKLVISDTGVGISPKVQEKLFTPFFSTKPTGQGVGLTMVREIFHNHGLNFRLFSADGETRFEVEF